MPGEQRVHAVNGVMSEATGAPVAPCPASALVRETLETTLAPQSEDCGASGSNWILAGAG